jgi:hypothetical protein
VKNNTSPMRAFATVATRSQLAQILLEREHKVRTHEGDDRSTKLPWVGPKILTDDLPGFDSISVYPRRHVGAFRPEVSERIKGTQ